MNSSRKKYIKAWRRRHQRRNASCKDHITPCVRSDWAKRNLKTVLATRLRLMPRTSSVGSSKSLMVGSRRQMTSFKSSVSGSCSIHLSTFRMRSSRLSKNRSKTKFGSIRLKIKQAFAHCRVEITLQSLSRTMSICSYTVAKMTTHSSTVIPRSLRRIKVTGRSTRSSTTKFWVPALTT